MSEDPYAALQPVIEAFAELGIAYYVGGSLASSLYGIPRATNDADVIAALRPRHAAPLERLLSSRYYIDAGMIAAATRADAPANIIHNDTVVKIDLYGEASMPFTREALDRARTMSPLGSAIPIRFAAPEDVILAKLLWFRKTGERSQRQWGDLLGVIRVQAGALDMGYLGRWLARLDLDSLFERLQGQA